jgi:hypothetical protein
MEATTGVPLAPDFEQAANKRARRRSRERLLGFIIPLRKQNLQAFVARNRGRLYQICRRGQRNVSSTFVAFGEMVFVSGNYENLK